MTTRMVSLVASAVGVVVGAVIGGVLPVSLDAQTGPPAELPRAEIPRTPTGRPDLNGIWQALGNHHWDLEQPPSRARARAPTWAGRTRAGEGGSSAGCDPPPQG